MKFLTLLVAMFTALSVTAQIDLNKTINKAKKNSGNIKNNGGSGSLTNDEVIRGLREALNTGTRNSTDIASRVDGFNKNSLIRIPFPEEAVKVRNAAINMGMKSQVDKFELTLNRAAEEASKEAAPIFMEAIRSMSVSDGFEILKGPDNAATNYLNSRTNAELTAKFTPIVRRAIAKVELTRYWNPLASGYNRVPGVQPVNPDLEAYVTQKTLEGLFTLIAIEEKKIRQDPAARVTDILKKVFGN